jgi:hypothetical protein
MRAAAKTNEVTQGELVTKHSSFLRKQKKRGPLPASYEAMTEPASRDSLFGHIAKSDSLQVCSRRASVTTRFEFVVDFLSFDETAKAGAIKRADVDEDILAAVFRLDESEALLAIVEFHGTCLHISSS